MANKQESSPKEEYTGWKAPETGSETAEISKPATPENIIAEVPEQDRGLLRELGRKIFGEKAVAEVAEAIKTQAGLLKELGSGLGEKIQWQNIDGKKALWYGSYMLMGTVAAELGSPDQAEAAEGENHDVELKGIMAAALPQTEDGERIPLDTLTESQKNAAGLTYGLRQTYNERGGTPADYAMQVDDIWDVQREFEKVNFQYETSRAEEVAKWGDRVVGQYEQQQGLAEAEKSILDKAVGTVDGIEGVSARERVVFKEAVLRAIQQTRENPGQLENVLSDLISATEFVQTKNFGRYDGEIRTLEGLYEQVLGGVKPAAESNQAEASIGSSAPNQRPPAAGGESSAETRATPDTGVEHSSPSNLGVEIPRTVSLEFGGQYSEGEKDEIEKYVNHTLDVARAMDSQFGTWQEKYGSKPNFGVFQQEVANYISGNIAEVNRIEDIVNNSAPAEKIRVNIRTIGMGPEDVAGSMLDMLSGKVNLRSVFEASDDAFEQIK
ncbi:MAG: hypothetical protein HY452_00685 [Parcubacteria group bacterium]|nr:hypothetical protein [Parcubacteria group bacterium]